MVLLVLDLKNKDKIGKLGCTATVRSEAVKSLLMKGEVMM